MTIATCSDYPYLTLDFRKCYCHNEKGVRRHDLYMWTLFATLSCDVNHAESDVSLVTILGEIQAFQSRLWRRLLAKPND